MKKVMIVESIRLKVITADSTGVAKADLEFTRLIVTRIRKAGENPSTENLEFRIDSLVLPGAFYPSGYLISSNPPITPSTTPGRNQLSGFDLFSVS